MIRATAGTWLNYATTFLFQILFAATFGSSGSAGAFVIAFAIAVSLGGVFVTTTLTNVLPRMVDEEGRISRPALRVLAVVGTLIVVTAIGLGVASPLLAALTAPLVGVSLELMTTLLVTASAFLATLALSGVLASIALARGSRFLPALAPALPSTLASLYLLGAGTPTVEATLGAVVVGGVLQMALVGTLAVWGRPRVTDGPPLQLGRAATVTAMLLLLLALLPSLQRVFAATADPAGAAQFDYAARGMLVAQQLLIGGLVMAVLPDWTAKYRQVNDIRPDVINTTVVATLLLFAAGSIALVAAIPIVEVVFERGAFTAQDTQSVVLLVRLLVPGFVAEGLQFILAQAMLATGRTDAVLKFWSVRFATHLVLTVLLGLGWGAAGVAVAYSLSMLIATGVAARSASSLGFVTGGSGLLLRSFQAGSVTMTAAFVFLLASQWISPLIGAIGVAGVAIVCAYRWRLTPTVVALFRGQSSTAPGSPS
jgi:putative peptidoglycan lipid II flippase